MKLPVQVRRHARGYRRTTAAAGVAALLAGLGLAVPNANAAAATAATQYPQSFSFGVCPTGDTAPICEVDPGTVPKAMDVITPAGVSQADELNPLNGPVVIQPVTVP